MRYRSVFQDEKNRGSRRLGRSNAFEMNSGLLSRKIRRGLPCVSTTSSKTSATSDPKIFGAGRIARHSRPKFSTNVKALNLRPSKRLSETKSIDQLSFFCFRSGVLLGRGCAHVHDNGDAAQSDELHGEHRRLRNEDLDSEGARSVQLDRRSGGIVYGYDLARWILIKIRRQDRKCPACDEKDVLRLD